MLKLTVDKPETFNILKNKLELPQQNVRRRTPARKRRSKRTHKSFHQLNYQTPPSQSSATPMSLKTATYVPDPSCVTFTRIIWPQGALQRVAMAATIAAALAAIFASFRHLPPHLILRTAASCFLVMAPLFALREVVTALLSVDAPVASAIVGGFAGYLGALALTSGSWKAVSHGAMVVGVCAGVLDVLLTTLDIHTKALFLRWNKHFNIIETVPVPTVNACPSQADCRRPIDRTKASHSDSRATPLHPDHVESKHRTETSPHGDWPVWLSDVHRPSDDEYEHLVRSHRATTAALQQEQARIARLLATIEKLKAGQSQASSPVPSSPRSAEVTKSP